MIAVDRSSRSGVWHIRCQSFLCPTRMTIDAYDWKTRGSGQPGQSQLASRFDFVARQKVQGSTHLNVVYVVEQLPVIAPDAYDRRFGAVTARELVRDHVLRLTYTAHDMAPFARDLGYDSPPFVWERRGTPPPARQARRPSISTSTAWAATTPATC